MLGEMSALTVPPLPHKQQMPIQCREQPLLCFDDVFDPATTTESVFDYPVVESPVSVFDYQYAEIQDCVLHSAPHRVSKPSPSFLVGSPCFDAPNEAINLPTSAAAAEAFHLHSPELAPSPHHPSAQAAAAENAGMAMTMAMNGSSKDDGENLRRMCQYYHPAEQQQQAATAPDGALLGPPPTPPQPPTAASNTPTSPHHHHPHKGLFSFGAVEEASRSSRKQNSTAAGSAVRGSSLATVMLSRVLGNNALGVTLTEASATNRRSNANGSPLFGHQQQKNSSDFIHSNNNNKMPICKVPACRASPANGRRTSKYRGVSKHRLTRRWEASCWVGGKKRQLYLGGFDCEEKAARAYDVAALVCKGMDAQINFELKDYLSHIQTLRHCTQEELVAHIRRQSSAFSRGKSKYRGVSGCPNRWEARIGQYGGRKNVSFGVYGTEEEAARQYDRALITQRGRSAKTNFNIFLYQTEIMEYEKYVDGLGSPQEKEEARKTITLPLDLNKHWQNANCGGRKRKMRGGAMAVIFAEEVKRALREMM
jgi:hypothetical protein